MAERRCFCCLRLAAGIQLFSVWTHFPLLSTSECINKRKWPPGPEQGPLGAPSLPHGRRTSGPKSSSLSDIFSRCRTGGVFRCAGSGTSDDGREDAEAAQEARCGGMLPGASEGRAGVSCVEVGAQVSTPQWL